MQATTVLARGLSLVGTGGVANPIIATAELGGSILTAVVAIIAPFFALGLILLVLGITGYKLIRRRATAAPVLSSHAEIA